jgi:lipopolysaccharide biosynthesis glycosyltransferase
MNIAFNINHLGMEGLGATLSSLIQHCSDSSRLHLHFLCSGITPDEKKDIEYLAESHQFGGTIKFIDFNAKKQFGHLHSLHGDWTPYGRLLIPQLIPSEKVLYLDTDLVVLLDVLELEKFEQHHFPLAAAQGGDAVKSRDADFYINTLGFTPQTQVFNSGVLLFNLKAWNDQAMDQKCSAYEKAHGDRFFSADQTLLNAVSAGDFAHLPGRYNRRWSPLDNVIEEPENAIIHFIGSPKPWDLFGKKVHKAYPLWTSYNPAFWAKKYNQFSSEKLYRTWKIKKSIIRAFIKEYSK